MEENELKKAIGTFGGNTALAKRLEERGHEITPQAISQWSHVPRDRMRDVADILGVSAADLIPSGAPPKRKVIGHARAAPFANSEAAE